MRFVFGRITLVKRIELLFVFVWVAAFIKFFAWYISFAEQLLRPP